MELPELKNLCLCLAKATSSSARLYRNNELIASHSSRHMYPDPVLPYLKQILKSEAMMSVYVTPLYQLYGCVRIDENNCLILGPSKLKNNDARMVSELLVDLSVPEEKQKEYQGLLEAAPDISLDRMSWTVALLASSLTHSACTAEDVEISTQPRQYRDHINKNWEEDSLQSAETGTGSSSYQIEKVITMYVRNGQVDKLKELFSPMPNLNAGHMASDGIRQLKNIGICSATVFSRAAISAGMDYSAAFRLSDLYIQQIELLRDAVSLEKLNQDMIIDFAEHVQELKCGSHDDPIISSCISYVSKHIFEKIMMEDMAAECGYSRAYLSTHFKEITGNTLEHYILEEKIVEAKRILQFTDKPLCEISISLAFSSQSHFQRSFKAVTGMTPAKYREQTRLEG
ncbi:MAG: AraC family transcriptional regulator [Solobacterium sp.]|jgi:AraC-like DNA-binding protein|nr:AraC family transcriptional regulator [Solobacterium sp.]MCH4222975.1 AraC family transcriptional regulator [Solobacterium sp.]MCH4266155.1 AraC family transcriptional regulator [Solobacterium sp.]